MHPTTTYKGVITHKTNDRRDYLIYIVYSRIINTSKGISKATTIKQYGSWEIWYTFLKYAGAEEKLLDGIQNGDKTTLVSPFAA